MDLQFWENLCLQLVPFTVICVMFYNLIFIIINFRYAFKTRNNPEKRDHHEYFINEIFMNTVFFFFILIYPFLFIFNVPNEIIRAQIYFHLWHSMSWHVPCWFVYLFFARRNDRRKNRSVSYKEFKEKIIANYKDDAKSESKRKTMHLISPGIIISFYITGILLDQFIFIPTGAMWTSTSFAVFMQINVGMHFLWAMNIGEYLRLQKFEKLGQVGRNWFEGTIRPSELNTYSAAIIMGLGLLPFFLAPQAILISVGLIGAFSDAMASVIGKKYGKIRSKKSKKTIEGYIAGFVSTYLIVIIVNLFVPYPNTVFNVHIILVSNLMALGAAVGFLLVDRFTVIISDNFLNPIICGGIIVIIYFLCTI
ncbi:MAG: hypothetical protein ACTSWY_10095 [Promethearchaeota archaeon]